MLVVDDERDILELVQYNLEKEGYHVTVVATGEDALLAARTKLPDIVVLDLMLPGVDGLEVCRRLQSDDATRAIPIVMLTAKGTEADVVAGLEVGASDYVTKPFSPRVLTARIRAVLRRGADAPDAEATIRVKDLTIRPGRHQVEIGDVKVDLTAREFRILAHLAKRPGWVFTRQQLAGRGTGRRRLRQRSLRDRPLGRRAHRLASPQAWARRRLHRDGARRRIPIAGRVTVRRRRLFWRIYATYLVVVLVCTASVGFYAVRSVRSFYYAHTERELLARAQLVRADVDARYGTTTGQQLQDFVTSLGRASSTRITVIAAGQPGVTVGTVVADSDVSDLSTMANHINGPDFRPEIHAALDGRTGLAIRPSPTLGVDMMYLALPLREGGGTVDVIRVAVPLTAVNDALDSLYARIIGSALLVALIAAGIGLYVSSRISGQMRAIKAGAERIAAGDFSHELSVPRTEEFAVVAESLNHMASELDDKLRTLTQERNEREAVLSSMVEGVLAVDTEERVIAVNAAAARLLDTVPLEAEGRSIQEVVRNPDLQRVVAETLRGQSPVEADVVVRVGAEDRDLQANGTLLHADHDTESVVGAVVVLNDVTRLKRLEAVRRDFVANVSHELKTPVTSIKGFAETLEQGALDDPEAAQRFVRIIAGQADRLNSIIEDLLALSTMEQSLDSPLLQLEQADLCDVVAVALGVCGPKAATKHVELRETCPGRLLAPVNPPLLEQAVVNLVDNAVKYSPEGSTVDIVLEETSDEIVISVVDRGQGVAREHLPRLFERFYRVDKARSRDLGGTGLGLAIVKHIAQVHGGRVSVDSVVGRGSTFRIHLPLT